jgi:hypothetical protein
LSAHDQRQQPLQVNSYPNPFNPETTFQFELPEAAFVRQVVYDVLGRVVATLLEGQYGAGPQTARFMASELPSGVYLYRLDAGGEVATGRLLLLK